ncbi:MAG: hypothetical protein NZ960_05000 [Candidatus Kapabacteria bacterium]|nr:hypothetical protein [Candidatus Kapabacteria bacterium]MDW8012987.1 hypothetical protein [Bacteroidota bacterium]
MASGKIRQALLLLLLAGSVAAATTPRDSLLRLNSGGPRWISGEELLMALYGYVLTPVWLAFGTASLVSPTVLLDASRQQWGWSIGTGVGWSPESTAQRFSLLRLQVDYERLGAAQFSTTLLADWNAVPIFLPELFRLGGSLGLGQSWRAPERRPYLQAEAWLRNAMGIWYMGLFPQHSLGLRLRYFPAVSALPARWQLALGWWATFVW